MPGDRNLPNRKVIEYRGVRINRREAETARRRWTLTYLLRIDPYWTIDGSVGGKARAHHHSSTEPHHRVEEGQVILQ